MVRDIGDGARKGFMKKVHRRSWCQDNTDGSETPLKCQGHQIAVKDTSDFFETVKLCQTPDTSQEHHGHQRPVGDSKDVSGIPHSCLECVSQVYSV